MKMNFDTQNVERSGIEAETNFQIKTSSRAFEILSSGIYTDNIAAVIRELSCNAYDSHVAANKKDVPFNVHLPNQMEPWFSVKDEGTGLSDDQVMNLYTTYFDSNKNESNDFIGGLGLGSKSPFAYTKSFEVISHYNGNHRVYTAFINEQGIPSIAKLTEIPTDMPNGIEVKIAVNNNDINTFETKASQIFKWFDTQPTVKGVAGFYIEKAESKMSGNGWGLSPVRSYHGGYLSAIQGNVEYKVSYSQLKEYVPTDLYHLTKCNNIVLYFDIGELEIAASREEIRYDERTVKNINTRLEFVKSEIYKQIIKRANYYKNYWDKSIELNNIDSELFDHLYSGISSGLQTVLSNSKNKSIKQYLENHGRIVIPDINAYSVFRYTLDTIRYSSTKKINRSRVNNIKPTKDLVVFYRDVKSNGIARIKQYLMEHNKSEAIVITPEKDPVKHVSMTDTRTLTTNEIAQEYAKLVKSFGGKKIMLVSETDKIVKSASNTSSAIFKYGGTDYKYTSRYTPKSYVIWKQIPSLDIDNKTGLYFNLRNKTNICHNKQHVAWYSSTIKDNFNTMIRFINEHFNTNYTFDDIYGVGHKDLKKFEKSDNWKNIFDLFEETIPEQEHLIEFMERLGLTTSYRGFKTACKKPEILTYIENLSDSSLLKQQLSPLINEYKKYANYMGDIEFISTFDITYGSNVLSKVRSNAKPYFTKELFKNYDILQLSTSSVDSMENDELDILFKYINTIDEARVDLLSFL